MNLKLMPLFLGVLAVAPLAIAADAKEQKFDKDKFSYAVGMQVVDSFKRDGLDINLDEAIKAMKDTWPKDGKAKLNETEKSAVIQAYRDKRMAEMKVKAEKNKKDSEAFLAANKKKDGVVTLPSGLQYKIVKKGAGRKPTKDDMVTMNYTGNLIDGTEFDSSYKRKQPAQYSVTGVFPGWQEGLMQMPEGSHWILYVPPELGFGGDALGQYIQPNSVLIMDIDLLKVEKLKVDQGQNQSQNQKKK